VTVRAVWQDIQNTVDIVVAAVAFEGGGALGLLIAGLRDNQPHLQLQPHYEFIY